MWNGKAEESVGRGFVDAVSAGTGAGQALAKGRRPGAATGREAEGVKPLAALETVYNAVGGGGTAGSPSEEKHRKRRWLERRLHNSLLRQSGLICPPPAQGRHSGGGGAGCAEPKTSLVASRNAGKQPSEGIKPCLRAPDPPPTNTSHRNQPRRRPISLPSRITCCRCRTMMRPAQVTIDSSHRIGPGMPR